MSMSELNKPAELVAETREPGPRLLVLFDGQCGLCNRSVRWFLRRDRNDQLRFTPSSSPAGADAMAKHGLDPAITPSSVMVVEATGTPAERLVTHSDAVLVLLARLPAPWPALAALGRLIPRGLRNLAYRAVARWRYSIWGRLDACPIPTAEERRRFL
jgi:predicted DCC family thiol-disulfide oxidoreductase YuxK